MFTFANQTLSVILFGECRSEVHSGCTFKPSNFVLRKQPGPDYQAWANDLIEKIIQKKIRYSFWYWGTKLVKSGPLINVDNQTIF